MPITYRDLTTLEEFARVVELERAIWGPGYDEVVPVPILAVTVKRGGILIGAYGPPRASGSPRAASSADEPRTPNDGRVETMIGFVYSLPGIKDGKPTQWSHMAGVLLHRGDAPATRARELGVPVIRSLRDLPRFLALA